MSNKKKTLARPAFEYVNEIMNIPKMSSIYASDIALGKKRCPGFLDDTYGRCIHCCRIKYWCDFRAKYFNELREMHEE